MSTWVYLHYRKLEVCVRRVYMLTCLRIGSRTCVVISGQEPETCLLVELGKQRKKSIYLQKQKELCGYDARVRYTERKIRGISSYICTPTWMMWELESLSSVPTKKLTKSWVPYFSFSLAMTSSSLHVLPEERGGGGVRKQETPVDDDICCVWRWETILYRGWFPSCPQLWANQTHQAACRAMGCLLGAQSNLED